LAWEREQVTNYCQVGELQLSDFIPSIFYSNQRQKGTPEQNAYISLMVCSLKLLLRFCLEQWGPATPYVQFLHFKQL
jgi:hypothetical protein